MSARDQTTFNNIIRAYTNEGLRLVELLDELIGKIAIYLDEDDGIWKICSLVEARFSSVRTPQRENRFLDTIVWDVCSRKEK